MARVDLAESQIPQIALQSKDHEEILDVIDHLRSQGINKYVSLPQLIVCGDQSSGKSSVLEAISGLSFPTRDNLCTRFATELILRRGPDVGMIVTIQPDDERSEGEKEALRGFKLPTCALEDFGAIVNSAGEAMGLHQDTQTFSRDVLRVEVTGPKQPHLTLVDLPGLYHAPDESQDDEGIVLVESLVLSYMRNERSIMLAVISAKSDLALQKVTAFTRKVDAQGRRTLGIITKPDTLYEDSDMELSFLKLAKNERVKFRLGWHVLKNRGYEQRDCSLEFRHRNEEYFLSRGVWASLPRNQVGIDSLRVRLSTVLQSQILSQLPGLIQEAEQGLGDAQTALSRLGESRADLSQQRGYLLHVSEKFTALIATAVNGVYLDNFFGDAMSKTGYSKRLRAVVQNTLLDFANTMREKGQQRQIIDDEDVLADQSLSDTDQILRSAFVEEVRVRMERSRGRELPGTFNPSIIGDLFYLQAKPWKKHVEHYTNELLDQTRITLSMILIEVTDEKTAKGLLDKIVDPAVLRIEQSLRSKITELLKPHEEGHPITCNRNFTENVQEAREKYFRRAIIAKLQDFFGSQFLSPENVTTERSFRFNMSNLVETLGRQRESDMDYFACSEAIDCMKAYYEVALKKFVDDFAVLAIEKCILEQVHRIFSPKVAQMLENDLVQSIAAESTESRTERTRLNEKLASLGKAVHTLRRLDRHRQSFHVSDRDFDVEVETESSMSEGNASPNGALTPINKQSVFQEVPREESPECDIVPKAPGELFADVEDGALGSLGLKKRSTPKKRFKP